MIPLTGFTVLLGIAVVVLGLRRGRLRLSGMGLGFAVLPVAMSAAAVAAQLIWTVILTVHPDGIWALEYRPAVIWIGLASLTLAITAVIYVVLRIRIRVFDLAVGGLLWWLLLAVVASVVFPPISYLFTWPLVLLGLGILTVGEGLPTSGWRRFAVLTITGIPAAFFAASGVYGITMTRELLLPQVAPLFAAAIVLMLGLLIPHLDLVARAGRWLLPGATAALALGLLLVGSLTAGFDARHPRPNTIMYALNTDTGQAIWESSDEKTDPWTAQFLGATPRYGSVAEYLGVPDPKLHSAAPPASVAAPSVRLLDGSNRDDIRTVRLHLSGPAEANLIVLETGSGSSRSRSTASWSRIGQC